MGRTAVVIGMVPLLELVTVVVKAVVGRGFAGCTVVGVGNLVRCKVGAVGLVKDKGVGLVVLGKLLGRQATSNQGMKELKELYSTTITIRSSILDS